MVRFLGACSGWGAQLRACEKGPETLFPEIEQIYPTNTGTVLSRIHDFNLRLAKRVAESLKSGEFPVILGGDHSIAIGTWNGVKSTISQPLGLIWIDAHMDSHTNETTPSGAYHGMPLAGLLGYGAPEMAQLLQIEPVLKPEHVVLIGIRSFEEGEAALLQKLNVKIYYIDEVKERGLAPILTEALAYLKTPHLGLTLDLDGIDPTEAPGVGSPEPDGLRASELIAALPLLSERLIAFELVEYNPERDIDGKTSALAHQLLNAVIPQESKIEK